MQHGGIGRHKVAETALRSNRRVWVHLQMGLCLCTLSDPDHFHSFTHSAREERAEVWLMSPFKGKGDQAHLEMIGAGMVAREKKRRGGRKERMEVRLDTETLWPLGKYYPCNGAMLLPHGSFAGCQSPTTHIPHHPLQDGNYATWPKNKPKKLHVLLVIDVATRGAVFIYHWVCGGQ